MDWLSLGQRCPARCPQKAHIVRRDGCTDYFAFPGLQRKACLGFRKQCPSHQRGYRQTCFGDYDIKLVGVACHLHGGIVDIHVAEFDVRCFGCDVFGSRFSPKHDVVRTFALSTEHIFPERDCRGDATLDAFDLAFLYTMVSLASMSPSSARVSRPEVDSACEFSNANNVVLGDPLGLKRRSVGELLE